jgi:hypothetical protein
VTEAKWLASTDPAPMLEFLRGKVSDRKLRLFACGYYRQIWDTLTERHARKIVEISELYADGVGKPQALSGARRNGWNEVVKNTAWVVAGDSAWEAARRTTVNYYLRNSFPTDIRKLIHCGLLRDIFGNPFCPVSVAPAWLTSNVVALATGIYGERAFDRMPILADALQDAGCANEDVLNHCRDDGVHVRGCWVVDLLLGKS